MSAEQGVVVAAAINRLSPTVEPDRVDAAQADLLQHARTLSFSQLQVATNHLVEVVDPEAVDETLEQQSAAQERKALASAWLTGQYGADGIARGRFALPNLTFGMLKKHLDAISSTRRVGTGADATTESSVEDLPYGNRLGRALCELIEHLPTDGHPQHGVANATIVVTVDETKLRAGAGEALLDTGGAISIGETRRLVCNAGVLPMVLAGESKILDLGPAVGSSTATSGWPWPPVTKAASSPAANDHPPVAKHTTASPGATADRPTSTTDACCAASTTT